MRIGYLITARLKSSRLKQKIILPLNGRTVLDNVIDRCKSIRGIDDVVLCTSTNVQDSKLIDFALNHKIKFYIGSEDDVLKRLLDAAKYYKIDAFLSITADNPLHSIYVGNLILDWVDSNDFDFVFTSGMPIGLAPYFIKTKALEVAVEMKKNSDTEIWGPFVNRPDFFNIGYLNIESSLFPKKTRLTCDYIEDYNLINSIYKKFPVGYNPSIFDIADLINSREIIAKNENKEQATIDPDLLKRISDTFNQYKPIGLKKAKEIGLKLTPFESTKTIKL